MYVVEFSIRMAGLPLPTWHATIAQAVLDWFVARPVVTLSVAFGFVTGGAVHSIADWLVSGGKKLLRVLFLPRRPGVVHKALPVPFDWMINPFSDSRPSHY